MQIEGHITKASNQYFLKNVKVMTNKGRENCH